MSTHKEIKNKLHNKIAEINKYGHMVADISPDELIRLLEMSLKSFKQSRLKMIACAKKLEMSPYFTDIDSKIAFIKSLQERIK